MFPITVEGVLPINLFSRVHEELGNGWSLNNYANASDGTRSWGRIEKNNLLFLEAASTVKLKISRFLRRPLRLCKIHYNGQTQGQGSLFHTDFDQEFIWTFVLFTGAFWNTEWGGEFVCLNPDTHKYEYTPYIPNTGVLIPSWWEHVGRSPTQTQELRTSVAFSYVAEEHAEWLFSAVSETRAFY